MSHGETGLNLRNMEPRVFPRMTQHVRPQKIYIAMSKRTTLWGKRSNHTNEHHSAINGRSTRLEGSGGPAGAHWRPHSIVGK